MLLSHTNLITLTGYPTASKYPCEFNRGRQFSVHGTSPYISDYTVQSDEVRTSTYGTKQWGSSIINASSDYADTRQNWHTRNR